MQHIAIDLGGRESQYCIRTETGRIVAEGKWATRHLGRFLAKQRPSRVVLETCAEAFGVADKVMASGHEVRVVPAALVKSLGVGARKLKTDRRDAQVLSEVSCRINMPSVYVPAIEARRRKSMCGMRERLIDSRTMLINNIRGWLRADAISLRKGTTSTFPQRVRAAVKEVPASVERLLISIEQLSEHIAAADKELKALCRADPLLQRLMTVPGVGPVTALRFTAAVDDVSRFRTASQVQSYFGLVPGERQSSERQTRLGLTKAGAAAVRKALVQAAWAARRARPSPAMVTWSLEVEKRRGKFVAVTALARKLAGILFAMWRDGTTYQSFRSAMPIDT